MSEKKESNQKNEYVPYGDEWRAEMRKWKKDQLIDMIGRLCKEKDQEVTK